MSRTNTLTMYYEKLRDAFLSLYGVDSLALYQEIIDRVQEGNTYTEFGIGNGMSLAIAMLYNPKKIQAYDVNLTAFSCVKDYFKHYAIEHKIRCEIKKEDSALADIDRTDLLLIDTLGSYTHLLKELTNSADKVDGYIIIAATKNKSCKIRAIQDFIEEHPEWFICKQSLKHTGFTTLKRECNGS